MFVDLNSFSIEKEQYNQRVAELKGRVTDPAILARNIEEERLKFKGITRKYLASAIAVLKDVLNVDYSLYKVGRDVDANFKTIETTVQKTQTEIANELNVYIKQANSMNLDAATSNKVALAINVIMSYVDDVAVDEDDNKAFYLKHSKITASSLDLPVTKKENVSVEPVQEIQHNPYANKPVDLTSQPTPMVQQPLAASEPLVNPFAGLYGEPVSNNIPAQQPIVSSLETASVVNAADVFGAAVIAPTVVATPQVTNQQFIGQTVLPQQTPVAPQPMTPQVPLSQPVQQQVYGQSAQPTYGQMVQPTSAQPTYGQTVPMVQPTAPINNVTVNDNKQESLNDAIPDKVKEKGIFVEKNVVLFQIISALLLPLIATLAAFVMQKVFEFQIVRDFLGDMPTTLQTMSTYIIVITLCVIFGGPILSLAKKRTRYLERFLVAPVLLSIPIMTLYIEHVPELLNSVDLAIMMVLGMALYIPFITILFISAFASLNMENVEAIKWNIFEKVGMLLVIYHFIIPSIFIVLGTLNITLFDEVYSVMYFTDSDSELISNVLTAINVIIPLLIMIVRTFQNRKRVHSV